MNNDNSIFGCFFKIGFDPSLTEQDFVNLADTFKRYIWGDKAICQTLKKLNGKDYGMDLKFVLFQFNVKPTDIELQGFKEIENYRAKEKSIGISIIVNDENFFNKSEEGRYSFLKQSIFQSLELLSDVVKKRTLDTKMELLRSDLQRVMNEDSHEQYKS